MKTLPGCSALGDADCQLSQPSAGRACRRSSASCCAALQLVSELRQLQLHAGQMETKV